MSMYTVNVKTLIELQAYKEGIELFADIDKYLEIGKRALFNYGFSGSDEFKDHFINAFIMYWFDENINEDFPPFWLTKLRLRVQRNSKIFYEFWKMSQNITAENLAEYDKHISETKREGNSNDKLEGSAQSSGVNKVSSFPSSVSVKVDVDDIKYSSDGSKNETESSNESTKDSEFEETVTVTDSHIQNLYDKYAHADLSKIDIINEFVKSFSDFFIQVW